MNSKNEKCFQKEINENTKNNKNDIAFDYLFEELRVNKLLYRKSNNYEAISTHINNILFDYKLDGYDTIIFQDNIF